MSAADRAINTAQQILNKARYFEATVASVRTEFAGKPSSKECLAKAAETMAARLEPNFGPVNVGIDVRFINTYEGGALILAFDVDKK